jgi:hypothetical protein
MNKTFCFVLLIVLAWIVYTKHSVENFVRVPSKIDGEIYNVHDDFEDRGAAADEMARINNKIIQFLKHMIRTGYKDDPRIKNILYRYDWQKMRENSPFNLEHSTSYMEEKGKIFAFCIRDKNATCFDENTLMFVTLHELSHLALDSWGHDRDFWKTFKWILTHAVDAGVYTPINYEKHNIDYCGLVIKDNPLFNSSL